MVGLKTKTGVKTIKMVGMVGLCHYINKVVKNLIMAL